MESDEQMRRMNTKAKSSDSMQKTPHKVVVLQGSYLAEF